MMSRCAEEIDATIKEWQEELSKMERDWKASAMIMTNVN